MVNARQCCVLLLLLHVFIGSGCQPAPVADDSELLLYDNTAERLTISPARVPVESILTLRVETMEAIADITAEVVGVSMYMGRVPVMFRALDDTRWQAQFLLGACTDPAMLWRLQLHITYRDGREQLLSTTFQSSWH